MADRKTAESGIKKGSDAPGDADEAEPEDDADGTGGSGKKGGECVMSVGTVIPVKKQVESSEVQTGFCKYCGQGFQLETGGECGQEMLDEWASEKCDCSEAKEMKKMAEQENRTAANIEKLFGKHAAADVLMAAVHPVAVYAIDSVTVNIGNGEKGTIKMTGKGKIQVKKTTTTEDTEEN